MQDLNSLESVIHIFFNKKPVYKKPVLMFQEHKKLAWHFSQKCRIFVQKWRELR